MGGFIVKHVKGIIFWQGSAAFWQARRGICSEHVEIAHHMVAFHSERIQNFITGEL